jgi:hypothetical protein
LQIKQGGHFYYEAMLSLMNKQTKILEYHKLEALKSRVPLVNARSREMNLSRVPIQERSILNKSKDHNFQAT